MQSYRLSESDKTAFRNLSDIDARAFIITMTAFAHDDITNFLSNPPKSTCEQVVGSLKTLNKMALEKYGINEFKRYIDRGITIFGNEPASRMDWLALQQSLRSAEASFRRMDTEGHAAGTEPVARPEETRAAKPTETLLLALRTTPLHVGTRTVNLQFIKAVTDYLQTLSIGQLHELRDFCTGKSRRDPKTFTEMFGKMLNSERLETLKSVVDACIVPSRISGLSVRTDSALIQKSIGNSQDRPPHR